MKKRTWPLAYWIFLGLILGIGVGWLLIPHPQVAEQVIGPLGQLFLNLIRMIVVPVVLFSVMMGVVSLGDVKKVGSIGGKAIVYYFLTTAVAIVLGLALSNLFRGWFRPLAVSDLTYTPAPAPGIWETVLSIFPDNIVTPLSEGAMLPVIVLAIVFGFAILACGEKGEPASTLAQSLLELSMTVMMWIIRLSPIGVFALIVPVVARNGSQVLGSLLAVLAVAYLGYAVHMLVTYSAVVKAAAGLSPGRFFRGMMPAMMLAFSSASSMGTLPLSLRCTEKLGASREVSRFVIPLGSTINMDGTAIYQGVCVSFIAACYGVDLTLSQQLSVVLTATLASIGTAGVPGAGMIMLAMVLESAGLPVAGIALVAGIDRLFDMGRTTVNITGDAACALAISGWEQRRRQKRQRREQGDAK